MKQEVSNGMMTKRQPFLCLNQRPAADSQQTLDTSCFVTALASKLKRVQTQPKHIDYPITVIGFSAMFTFQLDNTKS